MTEPTITQVFNLGEGVQYAVSDQGAIFFNGRQVVTPVVGIGRDFLADLHEVLDGIMEMRKETGSQNQSEERHPENPSTPSMAWDDGQCRKLHEQTGVRCFKEAGHDGLHEGTNYGEDGTSWNWPDSDSFELGTPRATEAKRAITDLQWNGFLISGHEDRGEPEAQVHYPALGTRSVEWHYDLAKEVIENKATQDEFHVLQAMAFMEWLEHNGLITEERPKVGVAVTAIPEWPNGTIVQGDNENEFGIVWTDPDGYKFLTTNDGNVLEFDKGTDASLFDQYTPVAGPGVE